MSNACGHASVLCVLAFWLSLQTSCPRFPSAATRIRTDPTCGMQSRNSKLSPQTMKASGFPDATTPSV
eukprot:767342-Alexandrium_andersonii.AAC.1